jgi:hypothetical protein
MAQYGPETKPARDRLKQAAQHAYDAFWGGSEVDPKILTVADTIETSHSVRAHLPNLNPTTDRNNLRSENLFLRPRHARSVGRRVGLEAERNRDKATLCVLVSNPEATVVEIAMATGVGRPNASRRLKRLSASGLTKPVCSPSRAWMLTDVGRPEIALADKADRLKRVDLNGHRAP